MKVPSKDSFRFKGYKWYFIQQALLPDTLPHENISLTEEEVKTLFHETKAKLIRYTHGFELEQATEWWYIIKDAPEDTSLYSGNTRNKIKRGGKRFTITQISGGELLKNGFDIYTETFKSYTTFEKPMSYENYVVWLKDNAAEKQFWGVYRGTQLCGFSINLVRDICCFYKHIFLLPESQKDYCSYILFHEMNKYYLNENKFRYVSDGARNISHATGVHQFLLDKFSFRKAYCNLEIRYDSFTGKFIDFFYPLRKTFISSRLPHLMKFNVLMRQEEIRRSFG